jgi:hypothetical protein
MPKVLFVKYLVGDGLEFGMILFFVLKIFQKPNPHMEDDHLEPDPHLILLNGKNPQGPCQTNPNKSMKIIWVNIFCRGKALDQMYYTISEV